MTQEQIQCPRCGESVPPEKTVCPNCKKILLKAQGLADAGEKLPNCPVCKIPIYPAKMGGHDIYHCAECDGTAYKRESLMKMQATDSKSLVKGQREREHVTPPYFEKRDKPPFLICPYCGKKMLAKKLGPMQTDMCEECKAIFLDGEKYLHINEMLGAYKMTVMNASRDTGRRRR
jgi:Zn-finger nucleic acid-binding protein